MHVGIHHLIDDPEKWEQSTQKLMGKIKGGTLPAGLKPVAFIPASNKKTTFCVWEADSIDVVRKFIDGETGATARNKYFEVDTKNSMGLLELAAVKK